MGGRTGFGNPSWRATHGPATRTAPVVMQLLAAGASIAGLAHMDELAYSLNGENMHYGTPTNPAAPGHIPGGSSSGTAVAVAAGHTEIGLGSDTGGSVRLPASYCGVLSFRPSWGRVSMEGACNLAKTLDVAGCPKQLLMQRLVPLTASLAAVLGSPPEEVEVAGSSPELQEAGLGELRSWAEVFRVCQAWEAWQANGAWVKEGHLLGPGIKERMEMAANVSQE
ncbi:uncharacterized protein HaLaN_07301, partial [Haematococcus lacustris]